VDAGAVAQARSRLLNAQRDLMTPAASSLSRAHAGIARAPSTPREEDGPAEQMAGSWSRVAGKWLRPYPHPAWRENVRCLAGRAGAWRWASAHVFLQPFKIPPASICTNALRRELPRRIFSRPAPLIISGRNRPSIEAQVREASRLARRAANPARLGQRVQEWFEGKFLTLQRRCRKPMAHCKWANRCVS